MTAFLSWYLLITFLGWLSFPLVHRLFPALPDRGYTLARAAGLLLWGYIFWIMASLGFAPNDPGGLLLGLLILAGLSVWASLGRQDGLADWVRGNLRLIISSEVLFLLAFAALAFVRSTNPEIYGTEKPMELAFINATLRSPGFPPRDPWLSGYAISYYHFGYILTAMLAKLTTVPGTLAFNLMLALVFGLGALGSYGVLYNLLFVYRARTAPAKTDRSAASAALLAPLFLLIVSNVEGFLEILHRLGLFWKFNADGSAASGFWTWLDVMDLTQPPTLPLGMMPERYLWWWRASRVVQDYDLARNFKEIIDEFPAFSFVLGDLHPHVLAIPFGLLAVGFIFNLFLGGLRGTTNLFGVRLHISPPGFFSAALLLGGLAFLNVWDILFGGGLMLMAYLLLRVREDGWNWGRLEDLLLFGLLLAAAAGLLYLPFFLSFSSQAGGILPNLIYPTRGAHLWVMFGTLLLPIFAFLGSLSSSWRGGHWKAALGIALGLPLALWAVSWILGWLVTVLDPDLAAQFLASQGLNGGGSFFAAATLRRLGSIFSLLTLAALFFAALMVLIRRDAPAVEAVSEESSDALHQPRAPVQFAALLVLTGALLVLGPEFVYLRDQFGWRMNTVFKFYYQAWMMWSLAASFGTVILLWNLRGAADWLFRVFLLLVLAVGMAYPVMAFATRTNNFKPPYGFTLDDFDRIKRENPDEAGAIEFLKTAPDGILAEAIGGSYSGYARIATYSGLPNVLGWPGHEVQWRGTAEPQGTRQDDIATLYTTDNWELARSILEKYNIRYVVVGGLERQAYAVQEEKFRSYLAAVYQTATISIYEVP
jgi:YYY domain-containing protein